MSNFPLHIKAILAKDTKKIYIFCTNGGAHGLYFCLDVIQKKLPLQCSFYSSRERIKILDSITKFNRYILELEADLKPVGQELNPGWRNGKYIEGDYIIGDLPFREVALLDSYNDLFTTHLEQSIYLPVENMPEEIQDIYGETFAKYCYERTLLKRFKRNY